MTYKGKMEPIWQDAFVSCWLGKATGKTWKQVKRVPAACPVPKAIREIYRDKSKLAAILAWHKGTGKPLLACRDEFVQWQGKTQYYSPVTKAWRSID